MKETLSNLQKLFERPLASSRKGVFYNTFPYPTKISPETIGIYIAVATKPGDWVLDTFAGSGSTGIAALLCEHPTEAMVSMAKEYGIEPIWGKRNAILYDIGTYATFATKTLTNKLKADVYRETVDDFIQKAEALVGDMYAAKSSEGKEGVIRYTIWTEILICPKCGKELEYFKNGTSRDPAKFNDTITCPYCHTSSSVDNMHFATEEYTDKILGITNTRKKRKIAWVYGTSNGINWDRAANDDDNQLVQSIENISDNCNKSPKIEWGDLHRAGYHYGITHLHHLYTARNYRVMSKLWELTDTYSECKSNALKLLLLSYNASHCTLMTRVVAKHNVKDFVLTSAQSGVLYISKLPVEKNILFGLKRKAKPFEEAYKLLEDCNGMVKVRNLSSTSILEQNESIDFVFTDPPFGDFIPYAEVNQVNELWLSTVTKRQDEIIISNAQSKSVNDYSIMLSKVFSEIKRVSKDNSPIAVVFHAAKASIWQAFTEAIKSSGLDIDQTSFLDKTQASFKQIVSKSAVQGDPVFLLKKEDKITSSTISDENILNIIIDENPHDSELECRHCYSLYVGKCLENGIIVHMDATQVYDYIKTLKEGNKL